MERIRYYTYKVTFIDLADYSLSGKQITVFVDYVPTKRNAIEAQLELSYKTKRNLVFLSTVRSKQRKTNKISSVKIVDLTKRQIHTVEKALTKSLSPWTTITSYATTGNASTFTIPSNFDTLNFTTPASSVVDTVTVSSSGDSIQLFRPFNLVIVPPGPVTEAPAVEETPDPQRDKMTERAEEDDRSVWDKAQPDFSNDEPVVKNPAPTLTFPAGGHSVEYDAHWEEKPVVSRWKRLWRWIWK